MELHTQLLKDLPDVVKNQVGDLVEVIEHNRYVKRDMLRDILGLQDRILRDRIQLAREQGIFILNFQDGKGYFISDNLEDILRQYRQDWGRAICILKRLKPMRQYLRQHGVDLSFEKGGKKVAAAAGTATTTSANKIELMSNIPEESGVVNA